MKNTFASMLLFATLFVIGCSNKTNSIVGTWSYGHEPIAYSFKEDNTYEEYITADPSGAVNSSGTWKLEGDKLTLTPKEGEAKTATITFKENMFYWGDFEPEYKSMIETIGQMTKDEYFKEFGYTKSK